MIFVEGKRMQNSVVSKMCVLAFFVLCVMPVVWPVTLHMGESLSTDLFKARLADISSYAGSAGTYPAIFDILDANNQVVGQIQVTPGDTYTFTQSSTGSSIKVHVTQTVFDNDSSLRTAEANASSVVIERTVSTPNPEPCQGVIRSVGEKFQAGNPTYPFTITLDHVESDPGRSEPLNPQGNAYFNITNAYGTLIGQIKVNSYNNQTFTYPSTGASIKLEICHAALGLTPAAMWAETNVYTLNTGDNAFYNPFPSCSGYNVLNAAQSLSAGNLQARLDSVATDTGRAQFTILNANGATDGQISGLLGRTVDYYSASANITIALDVCGMSSDPVNGDRAAVKVMQVSNENACAGFRRLTVGQVFGVENSGVQFNVQLDDISSSSSTTSSRPAIFSVWDETGTKIGQIQVNPGETYTFTKSSTGASIQVKVCQTTSDSSLTSGNKWASTNVTLLSTGNSGSIGCSGTNRSIGQSFSSGDFRLQLADVLSTSGSETNRPAVFNISDSYGTPLGQIQVTSSDNYTFVYTPTGASFKVQLCRAASGLSSSAKWAEANVFLLSSGGSTYGSSSACTGYTVLNLTQSIPAGIFKLKLADISTAASDIALRPAVLTVLNSSSDSIGQIRVKPEETNTFTQASTGASFKVQVCKTASDLALTNDNSWAAVNVTVLSNGNGSTANVTGCNASIYSPKRIGEILSVPPYFVKITDIRPMGGAGVALTPVFGIYDGSKLIEQRQTESESTFYTAPNGQIIQLQFCANPSAPDATLAWVNAAISGIPTESKCSGFTKLDIGQYLLAGNYQVRLDDVSSSDGNSGQFSVLDAASKSIGQFRVKSDETYTFTQASTGAMLKVQVCSVSEASSSAKWAFVKTTLVSTGSSQNNTENAPKPNPPAPPLLTESRITLHKGWNLVSLGGIAASFDSGSGSGAKKLLGYVYLQNEKRYVSIQTAQTILGSDFNSYLASHSFWAYSYSESTLTVKLRQTPISLPLQTGWNFIPVAGTMSGKSLSQLGSDCRIGSASAWDTTSQSWKNISVSSPISSTYGGMVVKSDNACSLGFVQPPSPPQ